MKQQLSEIVLGIVIILLIFGAGYSSCNHQSLADKAHPAGERVEGKIDAMSKKIDAIFNQQKGTQS
jgi:hypothetical protein